MCRELEEFIEIEWVPSLDSGSDLMGALFKLNGVEMTGLSSHLEKRKGSWCMFCPLFFFYIYCYIAVSLCLSLYCPLFHKTCILLNWFTNRYGRCKGSRLFSRRLVFLLIPSELRGKLHGPALISPLEKSELAPSFRKTLAPELLK